MNFDSYHNCTLCPRTCHADRRKQAGYCGCTDDLKAARAALHPWEEPCISGTAGSGTVFFTGCTLRCCFCQNYPVSSQGRGKSISVQKLSQIFLNLQAQGAHNINLVTPTQFLPHITAALDLARPRLTLPVLLNSGGYERTETIDALDGYVDIYLPDLKYYSPELSLRYSRAADYFEYASRAILRMIEQVGPPVLDEQTGLMKKGVIIRHMVLPGAKEDSIRLLNWMKEALPENHFQVSLMSQYTPFYRSSEYPEINRRITSYEYYKVVDEAIRLGLTSGFMQEKSSAKEEYTPPFHFEGLD
ncbi:MAG: radical SAM protein [Lachnospiraceae bacterium]|nr:radical SAM protein [Lachnospiraceae bacterium]